jgi:DNA-binding HxlR family transcriptional regulator
MATGSYQQFCPLAMASEILCPRWTLVLLRELIAGTTRFNELRRGLPRMSPALLSKRLKELEASGIISRRPVKGERGIYEYGLTEAGAELKLIVEAIGVWGHRWIETKSSLENLDPDLLMWDMRRNVNPQSLPPGRSTIQIIFTDLPATRKNWWLLVDPRNGTDLCSIDPGFDVDLYLSTDVRTMTEIYMGYLPISKAKKSGRLAITGERSLEASLNKWFGFSTLAKVEKMVA